MSKRALLIGLTRYQWSGAYTLPLDLRGGANDVGALAGVLREHFGFPEPDLRILLSEPETPPERLATAANIRQGLEWLIAQTRAGDIVLIYYSGHGSQWPDEHGDEIDGYDEALVPCDARDPQNPAPPQGDLIDDELHTYITRLAACTENLTIIFDCCHSAGGTRATGAPDPGFAARQADYNIPLKTGDLAPAAATAAQTAAHNAAAGPPPAGPRRALDDSNPSYVFLAACRSDESAYEGLIQPADAVWPEEQAYVQQTRGLFTYFLLRALRHGPTATYQDILTFLGDQVNLRKTVQHPQGEGPLDRSLFGGSTRPVDWLAVTRLDAAGLTLDGGSARGLAVGTVVQIYPDPGAIPGIELGQERPIGTATITGVYPLAAAAAFDAPPIVQGGHPLPQHARALVIRPVYPAGPLRVAVRPAGIDLAATAPIAQAIAGRPILLLVDPADPAPDVLVTVSPTGIRFTIYSPAADNHPLPALAPLILLPEDSPPAPTLSALDTPPSVLGTPHSVLGTQYSVLDTQHSVLGTQYSVLSTRYSVLAEPAANRLAMLAVFRAGLARGNPASALDGAVQMRLVLPGAAPPPPGEPHFAPYAPFNLVFSYPQAPLSANSTFAGPPLYLTLLRFGGDGAISQLYPPPGAQERLAPGQQWPPAGQEDYFEVKATPPVALPGVARPVVRERLKLFLSTAPLDLRGLLQPAIPVTPTRGGETARGRALPDLPDSARADWTSVMLSYLIVP